MKQTPKWALLLFGQLFVLIVLAPPDGGAFRFCFSLCILALDAIVAIVVLSRIVESSTGLLLAFAGTPIIFYLSLGIADL